MSRECNVHWLKRTAYRTLGGKLEGNRLKGRSRLKWDDNITMDLREIGWNGMDWIDVAHDSDQWRAFVKTVMKIGLHEMLGNS
jgi:hypothetical protein